MSLEDTLGRVNAILPGDLQKTIGAENLSSHAQAYQVVWVPSEDKYSKPDRTARNVLLQVNTVVEAHIQASTTNALEALRDTLLRCLDRALGAQHEPMEGLWGGKDGSNLLTNGPSMVVVFMVKMGISKDEPDSGQGKVLAPINHVVSTAELVGPGTPP